MNAKYSLILIPIIIILFYLSFRNQVQESMDSASFEGCSKFNQYSIGNGSTATTDTGRLNGFIPTTTQDLTAAMANLQAILQLLKSNIADIKQKIPINFVLGPVIMKDNSAIQKSPNITTDVSFPTIRLNFTLPYPAIGHKGPPGLDADPRGPTGITGPTGPIGDSGYWGTIHNTLY
jgi:hypothetical protein